MVGASKNVRRSKRLLPVPSVLAIFIVSLLPSASSAQTTTTTYKYDALGRLTEAKQGTAYPTEYTYDSADNRTKVRVNYPPQTVSDSYVVYVTAQPYDGYFAVLLNDTDPNFPYDSLTITGVTGVGSSNMTIATAGTELHWVGNAIGTKTLTYSIVDSGGLAAPANTGNLQIQFINCPGGVCP